MERTLHDDPCKRLPLAYFDSTDPEKRQSILRQLLQTVEAFDLAWYIWTEAKESDLKKQAFEKACSLARTAVDWSGIWVSSLRGSKEELFALKKLQELESHAGLEIPQDFRLSSLSTLHGCPGW